ncbi:MAG: hypothetical protein LQ340_003093 [Diploschistes diacapsis]|nr:MAG: hypothetical protein LQ340_003093 [Diploschistes diacapsis]
MASPVPVLVIGGCGFIGYHITRLCVDDDFFQPVQVASRKPNTNLVEGAKYHPVDICSVSELDKLIEALRPTIIIHCASPVPTVATTSAFQRVTIDGTKNILQAATEASSVEALIFTSSSTMGYGHEHLNLREDAPLADEDPHAHPYARTKATADKMVLAANKPDVAESTSSGHIGSLRTACIRLPLVYGERDLQAIPSGLAALESGQTMFQIGDGRNLWEVCSVENGATAHILLAKAMLGQLPAAKGHKIDGQAFNISDEDRHPFWGFARMVWKCAGWDPGSDGKGDQMVWVLPAWLALSMAACLEWAYWIFTLGTRRPGNLGTQQIQYFCYEHTYDISKAKERLGYRPVKGFEEGIRRGVEWNLREAGWEKRLAGRVKKNQ